MKYLNKYNNIKNENFIRVIKSLQLNKKNKIKSENHHETNSSNQIILQANNKMWKKYKIDEEKINNKII